MRRKKGRHSSSESAYAGGRGVIGLGLKGLPFGAGRRERAKRKGNKKHKKKKKKQNPKPKKKKKKKKKKKTKKNIRGRRRSGIEK